MEIPEQDSDPAINSFCKEGERKEKGLGFFLLLVTPSSLVDSSPCFGRLFPNTLLGKSPARHGEESATHWGQKMDNMD